MMNHINLFVTPAVWGIGPGPARLQSVDDAISAVDLWLVAIPDRTEYREERARMLALHDILDQARQDPSSSDLHSAKLAIRGMVRFARIREGRRAASYPSLRVIPARH